MSEIYRHLILRRGHFLFGLAAILFWVDSFGFSEAIQNLLKYFKISLTMVLGSMVAGGTALGGGAVAFPVLTKLMAFTPQDAKVFSLAIQSFGMTAASIAILCKRIKFYPKFLLISLVTALPCALFRLYFLSDLVPRLWIKIVFSSLLVLFAFAILTQKSHVAVANTLLNRAKVIAILTVGAVGGVLSGILGSGADICLFALLALAFKSDLKAATATSVMLMAVISVFCSFINLMMLDALTPQIFSYVHAAIPVVIVGAPLGAWICSELPTKILVRILVSLIACEALFTVFEIGAIIR